MTLDFVLRGLPAPFSLELSSRSVMRVEEILEYGDDYIRVRAKGFQDQIVPVGQITRIWRPDNKEEWCRRKWNVRWTRRPGSWQPMP